MRGFIPPQNQEEIVFCKKASSICEKAEKLFGMLNGTAVLDDGTVLEIKDMFAFCEYVENRW
mgnify:CR=1 FL=1